MLRLAQELREVGINLWLDQLDILGGQRWDHAIATALQTCQGMIAVLSPEALASNNVMDEVSYALEEGKIVIPILLHSCTIPFRLRRVQYIDFTADYQTGFSQLLRALRIDQPLPPARQQEEAATPPVTEKDQPEVLCHTTSEARATAGRSRRQKRRLLLVGGVLLCMLVTALYLVLSRRPPRLITNSIGMQFALIPAGEFQMGSNEGYKDERPVHRVRIREPFYLGKYEVTQAQWEAVMGTNPSAFKGHPNRPVETVSWEDVQEFITRLNKQEGWEVCRLPTEAQWEYAARAGTTTDRYENDVDAIAWYGGNSGKETHDVGQKRPNAWGVYDMLGNVWEWCHAGNREYTADAVIDPIGPIDAGAPRGFRGGSWSNPARNVRAVNRGGPPPSGGRSDGLGFRCASSGPSK